MSAVRPGAAGATRACPHCKATILESSAVCPACRGHLRFDAPATDAAQRFVPLQVEGTIHGNDTGSFEYTMVVVMRKQFPNATRRLRIAIALPMLRTGRPKWMRSLGRCIAPMPEAGSKDCGGCDGCD